MKRFFWPIADFSLRHRSIGLSIWLVLVLLCCSGITQLSIAYDYRSFFDDANPELQSFNKVEQKYAPTDSVNLIVYTGSGTLFNEAHLKALDWLTQRGLDIPYSTRSQSMANFQYSMARGDDIMVEPLFAPLGRKAPSAAQVIEQRALFEPLVVGRLVSADGSAAQVIVTVKLPTDQGNVLPEIKAAVEEIEKELATIAPDLSLATTGVVMLSNAFFDITLQDMIRLFPVMGVLVVGVLTWFFSSFRAAGYCLLVISLSIGIAMGLAGWWGVALTPATGPVPVVIMTVALVDSVHIVSTFFRLRRDMRHADAVREAIAINLRPIVLTSVTTAIGFASLNFSDTPPFREFGNIAAVGTLVAGLASISLLPVLLLNPRMAAAGKDRFASADLLVAFTRTLKPARWFVVCFVGAASLAAIWALGSIKVEDNFVEWVGEGQPFRQDAALIQDRLPALFSLQFSVEATQQGQVTSPSYLKDLAALREFLESQPGVSHVASFDQIMRRLNRNLNGDDPAFDVLPSSQQLAAQYLLLYELSLPFGEDLTTLLTIDRTASRLVATLKPQSSRDMRELRAQTLAWAEDNQIAATPTAGTGTNMIFAEVTASNTKSMFIGSMIAAIGIGLILMIALRTWRLGLLSLMPNIVPPLLAFGIWAATVGSIGLYGAFVISVSLGLVVDATVHMLEKYASYSGNSQRDVISQTVADVGPPILISSSVLITGFAVLTFSTFALIGLLAKLVLLTLAFAVLADFVMLPALLYCLEKYQAGDADAG